MSGIGGIYDIELNSVGYRLSRQPRTGRPVYTREEAPQFVNRNASGDSFYRDATFWSHWVQLTWQNGAKQEFFNDAGRFWKNSATDPTDGEKLLLSQRLETMPTVSVGITKVLGTRDRPYNSMYVGLADGNIYRYPSGNVSTQTWAWDTSAVSGEVNFFLTDVSANGSNLLWAGFGTTSASTPAPSVGLKQLVGAEPGTWSDVIVDSAAATFAATAMANWGGTYYVGTNIRGALYSSVDGTAWNLQKEFFTPSTIWALKEYAGFLFIGLGKPNQGVSTDNYKGALYRYDGTTFSLVSPFDWTEVTALEVYNGTLFIGTFHGEIFIYDLASLDKLFDIPGAPRINGFSVFDDKLHIITESNSDGSHWVFDRRGFHRPTSLSSNTRAILPFYNKLNLGAYSTTIDLYQQDSYVKYNATGTLQTSYFDANLPSLDKLWKETTLQWDSLPDSTSVKIEYKGDESDSFTTLATVSASASSREYTFAFPSGVYDKKLSYQLTLSTSVSTQTPTLRRMITKYRVMPDFYYRWQLGVDTSEKIQLLDSSYATSSGRDLQSRLLTDKRLKSIVQFKDIDYTSAKINGSLAASAAIIPVFTDPTTLFPLQGRLRIPGTDEEVTYTSATVSSFLGVTRGIKKTRPVSAATSATIDNSYRVLFDELTEQQFSLNLLSDRIENVTPISLIEV